MTLVQSLRVLLEISRQGISGTPFSTVNPLMYGVTSKLMIGSSNRPISLYLDTATPISPLIPFCGLKARLTRCSQSKKFYMHGLISQAFKTDPSCNYWVHDKIGSSLRHSY